ncbi:hypothetical protein PIROE2DRAFT_64852 [Piromyces sp. E2]|nr:hypothetical protein PIROE2DRAFT_64852 [Piromyces sp. E2]|eukprot:OUM57700.1 hypothetical protein PIROE2DRAFT_64852 [Piromyces sp. E2]
MSSKIEIPYYYDLEPKSNTCFHAQLKEKKILGEEDVSSPDHDIVNIGREYLTTTHTTFTIKRGSGQFTDNTIVILNHENKEVFNFKKKWYSDSTVLRDCHNTPILTSRYHFSIKRPEGDSVNSLPTKEIQEKITISSGYSIDGKYGEINSRYILNKVGMNVRRAEFENKILNKKEILEIRHQHYTPDYYVYSNVGETNEIMICKFKFEEKKYTIEIAPRVDYMYMLAICLNILIL